MAILQDLFTAIIAAFWGISKTNANTTVLQNAGQLEIVNTDGTGGIDGVVTSAPYDLTALALVNFIPVRLDGRVELWVTPHDIQNIDPTTVDNYMRLYISGGDVRIAIRIAGGTVDDTYSGSHTAGQVLEMNFPTTGDDVRIKINTIERDQIATFPFSRNCYIGLLAYTDTIGQEVHIDTFNMTYQAAASASALLLLTNNA